MNLTESIKNVMIEGTLKWETSSEDTGAQEAKLQDGSKFTLKNVAGNLIVSFIPSGGTKGNQIFKTPTGQPLAFMKAKQEAEKFLGIKKDKKADKKEDDVEEELGPENEWGTDELTNKEKAVTPGQTPKKEGLEDACWSGYKAIGTKEKDGKTVPNCVPEAIGQSGMDVNTLATKMGFSKPTIRKAGGQISYRFKGVTPIKLSAGIENAGYPEIDSYQFGDEHITDHKKGDVVLRVGPADQGSSAWLTIISDYKNYSAETDLYQESASEDETTRLADIESIKRLIAHPDTTHAIQHYGSVEKYRQMLQTKLENLLGLKEGGTDYKTEFPKLNAAEQDNVPYHDRVYYHGINGSRLKLFLKTGEIPKARQAFGGDYSISTDYEDAKGYAGDNGRVLVLKVDPSADFKLRDPFEEESTDADIEDSGEGEFLVNNPSRIEILGEADNRTQSDLTNKASGKPMDYSDLESTNEAIAGATMVTLKPSDKLTVKYGSVLVNDRPFEMTDPDESQDWPKSVTPEGKLITWFKGRQSLANEWSPEEITGYYTDELVKTESTQVSEKHVRMIQLIAEESNRTLIEKFLAENTIIGRETELSAIRADFKRFKKLHSHK